MMRRVLIVVVVAGLAGCGGCRRSLSSFTHPVPADVVSVELPRFLATDAQTASTACGIPLSGLVNVEVFNNTSVPVNPDTTNRTLSFTPGSEVQIRGSPADPGAPPMRCEALLQVAFRQEGAAWIVLSAVVISVSTPGVNFTPKTGGGHHHHHH